MDKIMFESYRFKAKDVIEGLNRYFAETKAFRYLRASLEIRRGVCYNNPDCVKDIVFTSSTYEARSRLVRDAHYLICDPEEVVGVAINWLREEHDIFYTPWMEVPVEDFDVDEAAKEYEKATRKDIKEALQKRLHEAKKRIAALEQGHAEKNKIIDRQAARIKELEESIDGLKANVDITSRQLEEQRDFITKVAELLETKDPYIEREYKAAISTLSNIVKYPNRYRWLYTSLKDGMASVLQEAEERED